MLDQSRKARCSDDDTEDEFYDAEEEIPDVEMDGD